MDKKTAAARRRVKHDLIAGVAVTMNRLNRWYTPEEVALIRSGRFNEVNHTNGRYNPLTTFDESVTIHSADSKRAIKSVDKHQLMKFISSHSKPTTARNYISQLNSVLPEGNLIPLLKNPKSISKLVNKAHDHPGSRLIALQSIMVAMKGYPRIIQSIGGDEIIQQYDKLYSSMRETSDAVSQIAGESEEVPKWGDIVDLVVNAHQPYSWQRLFIKLYDAIPARNDFGGLYIRRDGRNDKDNYIYKDDDSKWRIVLNHFKTSKKRGKFEEVLPDAVSDSINVFTEEHGLDIGDSIFPKSINVHKILQAAGLENGSTNLLRHSKISSFLESEDGQDPAKRVRLAELMAHSVETQAKYRRRVKSTE